MTLTNGGRGRNLCESPGLVTRPGPVVTTLGHIIIGTGSQVLGSSLGPAANERPGCGSRDPGRPIGGRYWDRVPGPAHPGCVGLSQSELGPVATHKTALRSPERRLWPDLSPWHFMLFPQLVFLCDRVFQWASLCLVSAESGPSPGTEPEQWCRWWEAAKSSFWGNILMSCRNSGRHSRD